MGPQVPVVQLDSPAIARVWVTLARLREAASAVRRSQGVVQVEVRDEGAGSSCM